METGFQDWLKLWPYAVVMIVVASWVLYHFLAPASWRDWTGAGLVQAFIVAGLILIMRGWSRVYFQGGRLLTDGVYGVVRHPQYTGIFLAVFGQLVHWPTIPTLALAPLIVLAYVHLARREERQMIARFGEAYVAYRQRVPMFFPRWRHFRELMAT